MRRYTLSGGDNAATAKKLDLKSPCDGSVHKICVSQGASVSQVCLHPICQHDLETKLIFTSHFDVSVQKNAAPDGMMESQARLSTMRRMLEKD